MNKIAIARQQLNMTQHNLAKKLKWTQSRIGNYESGIRKPDLKSCREIVLVLNELGGEFTLDEIFPPEGIIGEYSLTVDKNKTDS